MDQSATGGPGSVQVRLGSQPTRVNQSLVKEQAQPTSPLAVLASPWQALTPWLLSTHGHPERFMVCPSDLEDLGHWPEVSISDSHRPGGVSPGVCPEGDT
jgi:hypothetical protein